MLARSSWPCSSSNLHSHRKCLGAQQGSDLLQEHEPLRPVSETFVVVGTITWRWQATGWWLASKAA